MKIIDADADADAQLIDKTGGTFFDEKRWDKYFSDERKGGRDFLRGHEKWPIFTYILRRSLGKWSQDKALKLPVVPFKISLFPFSHRCYWILAVNPVLSNFDPG